MNSFQKIALGALALGAGLVARADVVLYDNLVTPLNTYIGGFGPYGEIADDIQMTAGGIFGSAKVAYASVGFDGNETLTLTLYAMDGAPTPGSFGFNTPGTALYTQTVPLDGSGLALFSDPTPSTALPGNIAVGLDFNGVDFDPATSDAGPLLYDPPVAPASSFYDYWLKDFAGDPDWALYDFGGNPPANFGLQITSVATIVPEPGTWMGMIGLGVVAAGALWRRARR